MYCCVFLAEYQNMGGVVPKYLMEGGREMVKTLRTWTAMREVCPVD